MCNYFFQKWEHPTLSASTMQPKLNFNDIKLWGSQCYVFSNSQGQSSKRGLRIIVKLTIQNRQIEVAPSMSFLIIKVCKKNARGRKKYKNMKQNGILTFDELFNIVDR
ncbi:60S ribosomal protein L12 [Galemys pyrenaicus]|uniref:60S ribosomal protein L12 n=1 Tax=Galemys pyrenaicus TaxID=202257 RepID=A0A8J6A463_GALPY|nr:60S ribosomal protein L12 [Galemys pyrenaicus]